jgi:Zn-finger nucleic acid-binding protein
MRAVEEADITVDECTACGGVFLDRGELNVLATGMAGDIEFCSREKGELPDRFGARACPRCANTVMEKVDLLRYTGIIFDYCRECQGFFLDRGELNAMNDELKAIAGKEHGEELRTYRDERLVTVDLVSGVALQMSSPLGTQKPAGTTSIMVAVHFRKPLGIGLRVHGEGWTVKLAKAFGLYRGQDISTGNKDFDGSFVIQSENPSEAQRVLSPEVQEALLKFLADGHKLGLEPGSLQILDDRIIYTEGPYPGEIQADVVAASPQVVEPMLAIAGMMEAG